MGYKVLFKDIEDFANELKICKAKRAWYLVETEQTPIQKQFETTLEDGTKEVTPRNGVRLVTSITITALGYSNPIEDQKQNAKPDTQVTYNEILNSGECFTTSEIAEYDKKTKAMIENVLMSLKKVYDVVLFEGVITLS
jgi:hypothetical protein